MSHVELRRVGWRPPEVIYVGRLVGVVVGGRTVPVRRRVLGVVDGHGLVTAKTKAELTRGLVDRRPTRPTRARWVPLEAVLYDRWRPSYGAKHWVHETPGALVALVGRKRGPVTAYLQAPSERRCASLPGDFLCSAT